MASPANPATSSATANRIVTKNSNRGFQFRKVQQHRTPEQEALIRVRLHHEIEEKTKACSNIVYDCSLPRVEKYEYCLKHILLDPKAPYTQCSYTYPRSAKRCQQPAPKCDVYTSLCFEHSRQTQLQQTRQKFGTYRNVETNETLLRDLAHRVDPARNAASLAAANNNKYVDPFGPSARVLNYASDDSDAEPAGAPSSSSATAATAAAAATADADDEDVDVMLDAADANLPGAWTGQDMDQSDNESVDSQNEDFLKHAGIYTTEEATVITKSKMVRLQTLYSEQIYRLHHLLRQRRRSCLLNLRVERDALAQNTSPDALAGSALGVNTALGTTAAQALAAGATIVQPRKTQKQKALNQYLKKHGVEAVLQHKAVERRAAATACASNNSNIGGGGGSALNAGGSSKQLQQPASLAGAANSPVNRCVYSEGGVKCAERGIPLTKYCRKHILEDRAQVLFKACGIEKSGVVCQEPVPITFENATCVLHFELPPQRAYTQKKYESDEGGSDDDDEVTAIIGAHTPNTSVASTTAATVSTTTTVTLKTTTTLPGLAASAKTATREQSPDAVELVDKQTLDLYSTSTCIEQSAEAMSPLCVSPMDMESDSEVASTSQAVNA